MSTTNPHADIINDAYTTAINAVNALVQTARRGDDTDTASQRADVALAQFEEALRLQIDRAARLAGLAAE
jgi:alpha-D-ribose 1-methylphosphonate 5-triphosphate synthase subunit PhnI